jgi:hypothetical protein
MPDQLDSNVHTKETPAQKWAAIFEPLITNKLRVLEIKLVDYGGDYFEFQDNEGKLIKIKFTSK